MKIRILPALAIGLSFTLAACSGEPSEADMLAAVEKTAKAEIEAARAQMKAIAGANNPMLKNMLPTYEGIGNFKKLSCVAAKDAPGHICDFQMAAKNGGRAQNAKGRFFKGSDGYEVEEVK